MKDYANKTSWKHLQYTWNRKQELGNSNLKLFFSMLGILRRT